ncbi:hypothetical protein AXE80_01500 [Wenyingzhuangia fucanilytica]|uniref:DUF2007 domain-containing protein n=1 Tax=Wenyingzhuangia fucanilytica TaxID=1790137 RepID=A0A1B1Y2T9_9FLAO|nr:DUF2007 domain-containing protein [Wenyingzhuangia fucanilytica]ANW95049.1 hypothetical protein AXE80_01500 [Wenyingzhuangia fucanilytica]
MAFIKVFSGSLVEVQYVRQILQDQGIEPIVRDTTSSAAISGFGALTPNFQELFVHSDQEIKVKEIISSIK